MNQFGLDRKTLDDFHSVFARYPKVEEVIIYGSRAMGTHRVGSDIDLCMKGRDLNDADCRRIALDLDGLNTPYLVDISVHHLVHSESLLQHIRRVGRSFYRKRTAQVKTAV